MTYRDMIGYARANGVATEEAMWSSVDQVDKMLEALKEEYPDLYWTFLRKTHASLYGCHYDECFATYDVSQMHSTKDGVQKTGEHWSIDEIRVTDGSKTYAKDVTDWDKYVAYNAMWHDLRKQFADEDVLEAAYLFFFGDEDACEGKVWCYMNAMCKCGIEE